MELEIKAALMKLRDGIKGHDAVAIATATAELDDLLARFRPGLHPRLAHFLSQRSYVKALAWLEGDARTARERE